MMSKRKKWINATTGSDLAALVVAARQEMKAKLEELGAVDAHVCELRLHSPARYGAPFAHELVFGIEYATTVTLDAWLDEVMADAVVGQGPGTVRLTAEVQP